MVLEYFLLLTIDFTKALLGSGVINANSAREGPFESLILLSIIAIKRPLRPHGRSCMPKKR